MPEESDSKFLNDGGARRKPWPSERLLLLGFLLLACIFSVIPIHNQIRKAKEFHPHWNAEQVRNAGTKDYPTWYDTGWRELHNQSPYYLDSKNEFPFMYPPGAAGLLAPLTLLGKLPLVIFLVLLNSAAWATCILGPIYLITGKLRGQPPILYWLPSLICCVYIWDTYLEGQMAFCLSACIVAMLVFLKRGNPLRAGFMLAIAAGFKAFPILALPYLIYRRHWKALASTIVWLVIFLFVIPACFRGPSGAWADLKFWSKGILASNTEDKISPYGRGERSYTWQNGSVLSVTHRWFRQVKADTDTGRNDKPLPVVYINIADLPLKKVNHIAQAIELLLGIGYILLTPRQRNRTPLTDAAEGAMLLILIILASPMSFTYNNSWLMCGIAVVMYFILNQPAGSPRKRFAVCWLLTALLPLILSVSTGIYWWRYIRTMGNTLFADIMLLALLGWLCVQWSGRSNSTHDSAATSGAPSGN